MKNFSTNPQLAKFWSFKRYYIKSRSILHHFTLLNVEAQKQKNSNEILLPIGNK